MNFSIRASSTVMLSVFAMIVAINSQAAGAQAAVQSPTLMFSPDVLASPHVQAIQARPASAHAARSGSVERTASLTTHPNIADMTASLSAPLTMQGLPEARLIPAVSTQFLNEGLRRSTNDALGTPSLPSQVGSSHSGDEMNADEALESASLESALRSEDSHLDSLLLALTVAGLIVMQLRRKQKILAQRPLGSLSLASGANSLR